MQRAQVSASLPTRSGGQPCLAPSRGRPDGRTARLQRTSATGRAPNAVPPIVHEVLVSPGLPLDRDTCSTMSAAFGVDLSGVRVHADARASDSAQAVNALAYTVGSDIVFRSGHDTVGRDGSSGPGQRARAAGPGQRLLAHELAHVVQQRGLPAATGGLTVAPPGTEHERQADAAADVVMSGRAASSISPLAGEAGVQRQMGELRRLEGVQEDADELRRGPQYQAVAGDTLEGLARRFDTTVEVLLLANDLPDDAVIQPGQLLWACRLVVPPTSAAQMLAGAIFAEASPKAKGNDEREAIAWAFVNSVRHVEDMCAGTICGHLTEIRRQDQCRIDTENLGGTIPDSVRKGSLAYGATRWNLVMDGDEMRPAADLCTLLSHPSRAGEVAALALAIEAAEAVLAGTAKPRDYVRFNQAANAPPNRKRMERSGRHGEHTFYRFKAFVPGLPRQPGSVCE
jgi:hypothetical protein